MGNYIFTQLSVYFYERMHLWKVIVLFYIRDSIFKFGGITANYNGQYISNMIERYDANLNVWKIIDT